MAAYRHRGRSNRGKDVNSTAPQPLLVATDWGAAAWPSLGILLAVAAIATIAYVQMLERAPTLRIGTLLFVALAGIAIAWFAPVLFSSDVYAYAAYGEMARIGLNPYARAGSTADAIVRAAQVQWITAFPICVYGPGFVAFARALVALLAPLGMLAVLDSFRAAASLAMLLCIPLAYAAFPGDRRDRSIAAATIGCNPVAIWCSAEGHNDAIALAVVLAGFALARHRWIGVGAGLTALSALVKPPGAVAAVAFALFERRARLGAAIGLALVVVASLPLLQGIAKDLAPHGTYAPQVSLQAVFAPLSPALAWSVAGVASAALAIRGLALLYRKITEGWIWLGIAGWVLVPNPYPWYGIWLVALAALQPRSRAALAAILLSLVALLRYVPDAVAIPSPPLSAGLGILASLPMLLLLTRRTAIMSDSNDR